MVYSTTRQAKNSYDPQMTDIDQDFQDAADTVRAPRERLRMRICGHQQGFSSHIGPFYEIQLPGGMRRGLGVESRHLNPEGVVHGGVISSFADFVLYRAIGDEIGHELRFATVALNVNFLAAAKAGRWLFGEGLVLRKTRDLIFASGEIFSDERSIATASGVWKVLAQA
jgi:uncharacterized protein (TIGR00369 family)